MADLATHLAYLEDELAAAQAAPLSVRRARLVALLVDAYVDRLFAAHAEPGDILAYREAVAAASPALGLVLALCAQRPDSPQLLIKAVEVPLADYGGLPVEDFMVSLYNDHMVQRVHIAAPDGTRHDAHEVLAAAVEALRKGR